MLKRTIDLILKRVFQDNLIDATLTKRQQPLTLQPLAATKTALSFDNNFYEQTVGVSMGSCLAPVLANIILTEFEKSIINYLIKTGIITFYRRYVDDSLVLIKPKDVPFVLIWTNSTALTKILSSH